MQVKLKVLSGSNAGKEIKIPGKKFFIGRGEKCHLRPQSDSVSRHHCAFLVGERKVAVQDLKSRNGTLVNDERIEERRFLNSGDIVQVGALKFEVLIDYPIGGEKRPEVHSVKEAAARATEGGEGGVEGFDVTQWLSEADEEERSRRMSDPETRQFKLDDTTRIDADKMAEVEERAAEEAEPAEEEAKSEGESDKAKEKKKKKEKKEYGKLPKIEREQAKDSREAAADMLKKFFNRR